MYRSDHSIVCIAVCRVKIVAVTPAVSRVSFDRGGCRDVLESERSQLRKDDLSSPGILGYSTYTIEE